MSGRAFGLLIGISALFGASFLFIRIAAPSFGPVLLMDARVLLAGGALVLYALATRQRLRFGGRPGRWLLLGGLNAAVPFTLIAWAELHLTSSLAAMLIGTLPLLTALVASVWLRERLTQSKLAGLVLGLAGVMILSGWNPLDPAPTTWLAIGAMLVATALYALGSVYTKVAFGGVPPLTVTTGNLLAAGAILLPLVPFAVPASAPPLGAAAAGLALALLCTSVAYLGFFSLIASVGPTSTATAAYLIPGFGTLWGVLFLGEPVNAAMLIGFSVILCGVAVAAGVAGRRRAVTA